MSSFRVLAGDFAPKDCFTDVGTISLFEPGSAKPFPDVRIPKVELVSVQPATQSTMSTAAATAAGASIGWVVAGEGGLIAGTVFANLPRHVTFMCTLRDGRRFVAAATPEVYQEFLTAAHRASVPAGRP